MQLNEYPFDDHDDSIMSAWQQHDCLQTFFMKKILFLSAFLFISLTTSFACEICGCGVGNFYMGLLPNFKTKFIGVRYSFLNYRTILAKDASQFSNDYYKTTEIWSGWNIGNRWQVMAFVPYRSNKKISDDGVKTTNGLGDISLLANYKLFHTRNINASNKTVEQQLWAGAGIKMPTGAYHVDLTDPDANIGDANAQAGTGSTDILLNAMYQLTIQKIGFNTSVNYKINTANADQYRFGNRFTVNSLAFYRIRFAGMAVSPNAGLLYESSAGNNYQNEKVDETGGYLLNASLGAEINFNKITVGINTQLPVSQNFAAGQTNSKTRGVLHISFAL